MKDLKEKICPSIRADCRYGYGDNVCDNCNKILDEYIAEHDAKVRADAIDEFALKLVQWKPQNEEYLSFRNVVFQIAEQLKEQK